MPKNWGTGRAGRRYRHVFGVCGLYFFAYFHRMWYTETKGSTDLITGTCIIGKISVIFYKKPRKYLWVFPAFLFHLTKIFLVAPRTGINQCFLKQSGGKQCGADSMGAGIYMDKPGYFISIEGGDGSGKSTQIQKIKAYLEECGADVLLTREPGGTPIAERIRELILDPENTAMTARAEMLLYAAARAQHLEEKILPALAAGRTVLSDRFTDSSIAYQGYGRGLGGIVAEVNRIATDGREPDLTLFLNISPKEGMTRKKQQDSHELDRMEREKAAFHERVYQGYLALAEESGGRICVIDAGQPPDAVFAEIKEELDRLFGFAPRRG